MSVGYANMREESRECIDCLLSDLQYAIECDVYDKAGLLGSPTVDKYQKSIKKRIDEAADAYKHADDEESKERAHVDLDAHLYDLRLALETNAYERAGLLDPLPKVVQNPKDELQKVPEGAEDHADE